MITEKKIKVKNQSLSTYTNGSGNNAIIFVHGNSCSGEYWLPQLNDAELAAKYRLVGFDLPGHGKSGKSNDYDIQTLGKGLPAFVKHLSLTSYIVVSISLGTIIVSETADKLEGCKGFFMVSPNIVSNEYPPASFLIPVPGVECIMSPDATDEVLTGFASILAGGNKTMIELYKTTYRQTDPAFRIQLAKSVVENGWTDEIAKLKKAAVPVCILFGENEKVINVNYLDNLPNKWQDKVFHIKNAAHFVNNDQPAEFNKLLADFAQDIFK